MQKRFALALAAVLLLALAGCHRSEVVQVGDALDHWQQTPSVPSIAQVDIQTYDEPDFTDTLGFRAVLMPDDYTAEKLFVLDGWYAQVEFRTADERPLTVRVAAEGHLPLTTTFAESHALEGEVFTFGGVEVSTHSATEGCFIATWKRDGFAYLLHSNRLHGVPPEADIAAIVEGFVVAAGETA